MASSTTSGIWSSSPWRSRTTRGARQVLPARHKTWPTRFWRGLRTWPVRPWSSARAESCGLR
ncbi:unnamed protein product [Symbiodinium sp. CCMP2592]|nr:unnamed protein product [Symbiodinium sp. CCMP2592]